MFLKGPSTRAEIVEVLAGLGFSDEGNDPGMCVDAARTVLVDVGRPRKPLGSLVQIMDVSVDQDDSDRDDLAARARVMAQLAEARPDWRQDVGD